MLGNYVQYTVNALITHQGILSIPISVGKQVWNLKNRGYPEPQVEVYDGKWNDTYFQNTFFPDEELEFWRPIEEK